MQSLKVFGVVRLFEEVRGELVRDQFDFFVIRERKHYFMTCTGFEPTHLCDPSD